MRQTTGLTRLFPNRPWTVLQWFAEGVLIGCLLSAIAPLPSLLAQDFVAGQTSTAIKNKKPLDLAMRSIAVLEWNGPAGKPKTSILIPVAIYTNGQYIDGGGYLARPVPLAVQQGTQYVLEKSGVPQGEYNVNAATQMQGAWFGSGTREPLKATKTPGTIAGDPDRPHFFASGNPTTADKTSDQTTPTLHLRPPPDPDRPVMKYGEPTKAESQPRPPDFAALEAKPGQQMVAISDATGTMSRSLAYSWSSTVAKKAMQKNVEAQALKYLEPAPKQKNNVEQTPNPGPIAPAAIYLGHVDFRCFALTREKKPSEETPTCVLSAQAPGENGEKRFVTVIARPDIYGAPQVISYGVTDTSQLATHPRVRLVDAVNASSSQNADLLFELDGPTDRRFALYALEDGHVAMVYVTRSLPF